MSSKTDARSQAVARNHRLLENGYEPLPLPPKSKFPPYRWARATLPTITDDWLDDKLHPRAERKNTNTGIRTGKVVGIDLDIWQPEIVDEIYARAADAGLPLPTLVRIGREPRELWVFRTDKPFSKMMTRTYMDPGEDPETAKAEKRTYQVEVMADGQQFVGYGTHPVTRKPYRWFTLTSPGRAGDMVRHKGLTTVPRKDLPQITKDEVVQLLGIADDVFEAHGLVLCRGQRNGVCDVEEGTKGFCWDSEFDRFYGVSFDEILEGARPGDTHDRLLFVSGALVASGWTDDDILDHLDDYRDRGNDTRSRDYIQRHMIDKARQRWDRREPPTAERRVNAGTMLASLETEARQRAELIRGADDPFEPAQVSDGGESRCSVPMPDSLELSRDDGLALNRARLLWRYCYVVELDMVADLGNVGRKGWLVKRTHFMTAIANMVFFVADDETGKVKRVPLGPAWFGDIERLTVTSTTFEPGEPGVVRKGPPQSPIKYLNTYNENALPPGGDPEPGFRFVRNLFANPEDSEFFLSWLSFKMQHLRARGPSVVIVAADETGLQVQGTGRGTLARLIREMIGADFFRAVDYATLAGANYQAQYNDWAERALFLTIHEVRDDATNGLDYRSRAAAMERLKSVLEPSETRAHIIRKGLPSYDTDVFFSTMVFSNHRNALPLPEGDRRFWVADARSTPMSPSEAAAIHGWIDDPANLGAFRAALREYDFGTYNPNDRPPETRAKTRMIEAARDPIDDALTDLFGRLVAPVVSVPMLERFLREHYADELPTKGEVMAKARFRERTETIDRAKSHVTGPDDRAVRVRSVGDPTPLNKLTRQDLGELYAQNFAAVFPGVDKRKDAIAKLKAAAGAK